MSDLLTIRDKGQYGARPLLRAVESHVLAPLAVQAPGNFQYHIDTESINWMKIAE